jgi:hypothetical protein
MIFVFTSAKDLDAFGFTADETGDNLPSAYAPWKAAAEGGAVVLGGNASPMIEAVKQSGFFLALGAFEVRGVPVPDCSISKYQQALTGQTRRVGHHMGRRRSTSILPVASGRVVADQRVGIRRAR